MQLPAELRAALEEELASIPPAEMTRATLALSQRLRAEHGQPRSTLAYSQLDVAAYAAYRMPATFAVLSAVFWELRDRRPDLTPSSLLDIGGGPGTAAWAAVEVWPDLEHITTLERDPGMIRLGSALAAYSPSRALHDQSWQRIDLSRAWEIQPAGITTAGYVLGEIPAGTRVEIIHRLWTCTLDSCVVIEPGTPRGFQLIQEATAVLVAEGARIVAPFSHDWHCLERADDWCHFSQRVPRTRLLRAAKSATLSYEDEKYSYVIASRHPGVPIVARVIRHPQIRSGHIRLTLCTADGVRQIVVTKSNRDAFRKARDLTWGTAISIEDARLFGLPGGASN